MHWNSNALPPANLSWYISSSIVPLQPQADEGCKKWHWNLIDTTLAMLKYTSFLITFCDYGVLIATYLYNKNPSPTLSSKSLIEVLFGHEPNYSKLRVFNCHYDK